VGIVLFYSAAGTAESCEPGDAGVRGRRRRLRGVERTLVFIPAWNEERSLPGVLADARAALPDADVLVIDDGSTDATS
jgi:hypothetical protein